MSAARLAIGLALTAACGGSGHAPAEIQPPPAPSPTPASAALPENPCAATSLSDGPAAGWHALGLFDCNAEVFLPPDATALPDALRWRPCADDPSACRELDVDWDTADDHAIGGLPRAWVDGDEIHAQVRRLFVTETDAGERTLATMTTLGPLDGAAAWAVYTAPEPYRQPGTWVLPAGVHGEFAAWQVLHWDEGELRGYATLGRSGRAATAVLAEHTIDDPRSGVPVAGPGLVATLGASVRVLDEAGALQFEGGHTPHGAWWDAATVHWHEDDTDGTRVHRWNQTARPEPLAELPLGSRAVGNTEHMVWTQPSEQVTEVVVASLSAEGLGPPVVLGAIPGHAVAPPVLGCNRVAVAVRQETEQTLLVLDLDGGPPTTVTSDATPLPVALSCTELLASFADGRRMSLRRHALDPRT